MTFDDVKMALANSCHDDWIFSDKKGTYTYKQDLMLRIVRRDIDYDRDNFCGEPWANCHPDPSAYRVTYDVFYGESFICSEILVSVDGGRATLPMPEINTNLVDQSSYHFAQIVEPDRLDEYMERAKLKVR